MSRAHIAKSIALRLHLTPAPRTHSESSAVLKFLQDLGTVDAFHVVRPRQDPPPVNDTHPRGAIAHAVFTKTNEALERLQNRKHAQTFTVTANDSHKIVHDPYNVLGHKHRKPELQPQTIECRVMNTEEPQQSQDAPDQETSLSDIENNQYRDTFRVDRDGVFNEILARSGCPSGLIHGLLPRLREEHIPHNVELKTAIAPKAFAKKEKIHTGTGRLIDYKTQMLQLDLERLRVVGDEVAKERSHVPYDEFAALRGISLMEMYREATKNDEDTAERQDVASQDVVFEPFVS